MNYLGIDVSKSSHRIAILDGEGESLTKSFSVESSQEGFNSLLEKIKSLSLSPDILLCGLEATGNLWENIYSLLTAAGFKVIVLNPYQTNKYHQLLAKKAKTDDIDALVIAGLLRSKEHINSYVPDDLIQSLREHVKLRDKLLKDLKDYKRQTYSLLELVFPEYLKAVKNPFGIASSTILKHFPTATHFAQAKLKDLLNIVRHIQGNTYPEDFLSELIELAKKSIYSGKASKSRGLNVKILITQIEQTQNSIAELDAAIEQLLKPEDPESSLPDTPLSIPGVGKKTLAVYLAMVGDTLRFPSTKQLIGFIGLYPEIKQSGESQNSPHLTHRGCPILKHALYMAAVASLIHNPYLKSIYDKKISQGKKPKQALIVVARKIACMIHSMIKNNTEFEPERFFVSKTKYKNDSLCYLTAL